MRTKKIKKVDKKKYIIQKIDNRFTSETISELKLYSKIIKKIYYGVELLESHIKEENIKLNFNSSDNYNQGEYDLEKSIFLESDIKKEITASIKYKTTVYYMYQIDSSKILKGEIQFYTKNKIKMNELKKLGKLISSYILFFNLILKKNRVPLIRLYFTDKKKKMPPKNQLYFTPKNVNSAVTNGNYIVIFRKEEMIKSVLHEVIHYHHIENRNTPNLDNFVKSKFRVSNDNLNDLRLYEAQTDFLAIYLNLCFKLTVAKKKNFIKEYRNHFYDEIEFMLKQFCKIINHYNFTSMEDLFLDSTMIDDSKNNKITDKNTYSFSYYIIKLFYALNLPLDNLFNTTENELFKSVEDSVKDSSLNKIVLQECLKLKNKKTKKKLDNSLRMSLYG